MSPILAMAEGRSITVGVAVASEAFVHYRHPHGTKEIVKLTGERPIEGSTPPSLLALHRAGYREIDARTGAGVVIDVGCGLGDGAARFARADRRVVAVDADWGAVAAARRDREIVVVQADAARLAVRDRAADWACSSHLVEHLDAPETHIGEVARVLADSGTAFFVTPNGPADFENPYHVHLFDPHTLARALLDHFADVAVCGLDGDDIVKADFERRRRWARRLLALDRAGLRHRLPRSWYVGLHAAARRVAYPLLARSVRQSRGPRPPRIDEGRFAITEMVDPSTLVLFAVARRPRR